MERLPGFLSERLCICSACSEWAQRREERNLFAETLSSVASLKYVSCFAYGIALARSLLSWHITVSSTLVKVGVSG